MPWLIILGLGLLLTRYNLPAALVGILGSGLFLLLSRRSRSGPGTAPGLIRPADGSPGQCIPEPPPADIPWSERQAAEIAPAVALFQIDNYDEMVRSTPPDARPLLSAEIDRVMQAWASGMGIFLQKFAEDKYLGLLNNRTLGACRQDRFTILDRLRGIHAGNLYPVTLSIGVGAGSGEITELGGGAYLGLELAQGRGGDQAVIREADGFTFFGANTSLTEGRTAVKARAVAHSLVELMRESRSIVITGHGHPDLDSLGAALGIASIGRQAGRDVSIVLDTGRPIQAILPEGIIPREIPGSWFITPAEALRRMDERSLLVVVDTNRSSLLPEPGLTTKTGRLVVIDHHRRGEDSFPWALLPYVEPHASSTCELVAELLQYQPEPIALAPWEATVMLAGIALDTKNFLQQTGVRTFAAAAYLRQAGADPRAVQDLQRDDLAGFQRRLEIFRSLEIIRNRFVLGIYPESTGEAQVLAARAADYLLNIRGMEASFVLCPYQSGVLVSARSLGEFNVQALLERLGGGGHLMGAGAQLEGLTLTEARGRLVTLIGEYCEGGKSDECDFAGRC